MARRFRYKDIQLTQLRSFCMAALHGNFTAAAKALNLSAPTVWEQVRGLERQLGATLLLRRGRLVELTNEGRILLELVQPHVHGLDSLQKLFDAQRASGVPRLTIASSPNLLANYLVGPVREFTDAYPTVCVSLRPSIQVEESLGQLERGQADVGLLAFRPEQVADKALEIEHLFDLRLILMTAVNHPLSRKRQVKPEDVVRYPLIMQHARSYSRLALEGIFTRHNLQDQARVVMESSHADVIRSYVAAGVGVAVIYGTEWANPNQELHLRIFDPQLEGLPACLIQRKGTHPGEPVLAFRDIVRRTLQGIR
ncbi:MAG: LysR family transcriptional regulator [Planctomycetia bacterium]|nr:LysR family transcriptional regulator [Planctomycetia bacterium]